MNTCDLQFHNHGSLISCKPVTDLGSDWLADYLTGEVSTWGGAVMIEPRYLEDIVLGARADGLVCAG